jgi:hypothetical protein
MWPGRFPGVPGLRPLAVTRTAGGAWTHGGRMVTRPRLRAADFLPVACTSHVPGCTGGGPGQARAAGGAIFGQLSKVGGRMLARDPAGPA